MVRDERVSVGERGREKEMRERDEGVRQRRDREHNRQTEAEATPTGCYYNT